jgi:hypothetical protein
VEQPDVIAIINIRQEPHYRRDAIVRGLQALGYKIVTAGLPTGPDDLLVLWNKKAGRDEQQADQWEKQGGTVIVVENGYLQHVDKSMYAISAHGHCGSGWFPIGDEDRFTPLGFGLRDWHDKPHGHWLVCGQRGIGSRLMASPAQWGEKTTATLKREGKLVKFRPHPGNFVARTPLIEDLRTARVCVVWSSGAGVRALVEGIPVQTHAPRWICAGANEHTRERELQRMAHGQWRVEEVASGEPFARMKAMNWGPRWA